MTHGAQDQEKEDAGEKDDHQHCAQAAIEHGDLSRSRWESYKKLQREASYSASQTDYLRQKQQRFKDIAKINKLTGGKKPGAYPDD